MKKILLIAVIISVLLMSKEVRADNYVVDITPTMSDGLDYLKGEYAQLYILLGDAEHQECDIKLLILIGAYQNMMVRENTIYVNGNSYQNYNFGSISDGGTAIEVIGLNSGDIVSVEVTFTENTHVDLGYIAIAHYEYTQKESIEETDTEEDEQGVEDIEEENISDTETIVDNTEESVNCIDNNAEEEIVNNDEYQPQINAEKDEQLNTIKNETENSLTNEEKTAITESEYIIEKSNSVNTSDSYGNYIKIILILCVNIIMFIVFKKLNKKEKKYD